MKPSANAELWQQIAAKSAFDLAAQRTAGAVAVGELGRNGEMGARFRAAL